jgi:hypothetical protein
VSAPCRTLAIDPGQFTGWAMFDGDVLESSGLLKEKDWKGFGKLFGTGPVRIVMEKPVIYPGAKQKVPPNSVIKLALRAGQVAGIVISAFPTAKIEWVDPHAWKGSIVKEVHHRRVLSVLRVAELEQLKQTKLAESVEHNRLDAVALGLWAVGRMQSGGKRPYETQSVVRPAVADKVGRPQNLQDEDPEGTVEG